MFFNRKKKKREVQRLFRKLNRAAADVIERYDRKNNIYSLDLEGEKRFGRY